MIEENKYFTPSIEDIRVGYECEIKQRGLGYLDWTPYTIHSKYAFYHYFDDSGSASIRVPYLTKEQIEAEGWILKSDYGAGTSYMKGSTYRLDTHKHAGLTYNLHDIRLFKLGLWEDIRGKVYEGECKDINTFRYICKLLGI